MPFTFKGATISARELTIADENRIRTLAYKLNDGTTLNDGYEWAEFLIGADVQGAPLFLMASENASEEVARDSYAAWQKLPRRLVREWRTELRAVDGPNE